ncbi:MAG: putative nucleic acid-binding Zn ribbon protein [Candidatus Poriferisodalaceae bacterium]|jgi:predicted nucleic acid-binding Zn ribbon protein
MSSDLNGPRRRRSWEPGAGDDQIRSLADSLARVVGGIGPASDIMVIHMVWEELVGNGVAEHCQPRRINDGCLMVEVDQPGWATELRYLEATIVQRLAEKVPDAAITAMRVSVRR